MMRDRTPAVPLPGRMLAVSLVAFALAVCLRMPQVVVTGRFWAEEGSVFFRNAWIMPPMQALLTPFGGYLNVAATASTLAARWLLPLPLAPYLTIVVALLVQLCPPLLLLSARDAWLRRGEVRLAGVLLVLLVLLVPAVEEIWLQTLHCQFELTLCCSLVLALNCASGWAAGLGFAVLFVAPLCGPLVLVLLPLFLLRAVLDRAPARLSQMAAMAVGGAIQLLWFFHAVGGRGYALDPVVLLSVVSVRHLATPFLGVSRAGTIAASVQARLAAGQVPWAATVMPVVVFGGLAAATLRHRRCRPGFWLLCAGAVVAGAAYFGAIGGAARLIDARFGERYVFVPQALFSLAVLALAATAERWTARLAWVAVLWLLAVSAFEYVQPWSYVREGAPWRSEVALWRADHRHVLRLWPEGTTLTLGQQRCRDLRDQPCGSR